MSYNLLNIRVGCKDRGVDVHNGKQLPYVLSNSTLCLDSNYVLVVAGLIYTKCK